ncbi:MAG: helix-turn-helix domain-containing protein [Mangrovibacterium sp.]
MSKTISKFVTMKEQNKPYHIKHIQEEQLFWGLPKPKHPLVSVFRYSENFKAEPTLPEHRTFGFYAISIKKNYAGKLKYGQRYYDFDSGVMTFISPNQILSHKQGDITPTEGVTLLFHPDFLAGYPLAKTIKNYGFFSYEVSEALHLSEQEEEILENIFRNIEREYQCNIDQFSQDVIIAQIELLLQYSNRFYNRQFITRKIANDEILIRLENLLNDYFNDENLSENGLPTVQFISTRLNISPNYLSDMLRSITGQTTQQHIHNKLIDKAKELLTTTNLSVSEIAYQLGFEYPQSFNKLFKKKTDISPLEFRQSFN